MRSWHRNSLIYGQLISNKGAKPIQWKKDSFSNNSLGKTRYSYAKEWSWTLILHDIQKLTQNEEIYYCKKIWDNTKNFKNNIKCIKVLNVRAKILKLLKLRWKASMTLELAIISWIGHQKHSWQKKTTNWTIAKLKTSVQRTLSK